MADAVDEGDEVAAKQAARLAKYEALKAKFPAAEMPRWSIAAALEEFGRTDEAITELRALVALKPDYCVAWLRLGACLVKVGAPDEARAALAEAMRLAVAQGHSAPRLEAMRILAELDD